MLIALFLMARATSGGNDPLAPEASWRPPTTSALLQFRLLKIIESEQRRYSLKKDETVYAPTCVRMPTSSDFFALGEGNGARKAAAAGGRIPDLDRPATKIHEVFEVLKATTWGSLVLHKFLPKFGFEIKIEHFSDDMKATERSRGRRAAAVYDLDTKTIYVDKAASVGFVAPILLHEIVHSLDGDFARSVDKEKALWKDFDRDVNIILKAAASRKRKPVADLDYSDFNAEELDRMRRMKSTVDQFRDIRIYRAERMAYDMYYLVMAELAKRFPAFYRRALGKKPPVPYDDEELMRIERLNPAYIDHYRRGLCRTQP